MSFVDLFLHIDMVLIQVVAKYGFYTYFLLFFVIFSETGFIITPFLPGDSLLFTAGALSGLPSSPLQYIPLMLLLVTAAFLGNSLNYIIGYWLGPIVFSKQNGLLNKKHLDNTSRFYEKYGASTLILARFIPIIRTFAPFIAGIGKMNSIIFYSLNLISAILWVCSIVSLGYFFGQLPWISTHFTIVIYSIILISLLPVLTGLIRNQIKCCSS